MKDRKVTAIILAGGKSTRMGYDKAFIKIGGKPIIERTIATLKPMFDDIIIVANEPGKFKGLRVKVVKDIKPNCGPISGIHSGLVHSKTEINFVVACDMPFLNLSLIRYMLGKKNNSDIIMIQINGKLHPLFGIYSQNCILAIEENLKQDILKVVNILPKVRSRFISKEEIEKFDRNLLSLVNINTQTDLKRMKEMKEE